MLVVVSLVVTLYTFLVSDQFHPGLLIHVTYNCILLKIVAGVLFSCLIVGVVVTSIQTHFWLLLSISETIAVRIVWLSRHFVSFKHCCCGRYQDDFDDS